MGLVALCPCHVPGWSGCVTEASPCTFRYPLSYPLCCPLSSVELSIELSIALSIELSIELYAATNISSHRLICVYLQVQDIFVHNE